MRVGVGLPNTLEGVDRRLMLEWARRADAGPFSSLRVLDRVAYRSVDPLAAPTTAAAVTTRIGLVTMVAIGPLRAPALLAKQAAALDEVSGGRLTLGLAGGGQGPRRVAGLRPARAAGAVGPGVLRPGLGGGGGGGPVSPRLLRLHRAIRREDRRGQPDNPAGRGRPRPRLRGGRLRRAGPPPDGGAARPAGSPGRGAGLTMRIAVVGGRPAGLDFGLPAKKADPDHAIAVYER